MRLRKLVGSMGLLAFILFWVAACTVLAVTRMAEADRMTQMIFFSIAGLIWIVPAGAIIRWTLRP